MKTSVFQDMTQFKGFFAHQRILIVDDHSATRVAVARCFSDFGVNAAQMSLAVSLHAARELIAKNRFTIVVCEYEVEFQSGIDLIRSVPDLALSVIVSRNQADQAMAEAAENDVDVFLRKPFSAQDFKNAIANAILTRKNPESKPDFHDLHEAIETIRYTTQAKQVYDRAGYRFLSGLCDALLGEGKKDEAYTALRRLVKNYPVNSERLSQALRLSVETRRFEDVQDYYSLFLKIDQKDEELIRHAFAALVMAGKACVGAGDIARAMDCFRKAVLTSGKRPPVIKEVVQSLLERNYVNEADEMLRAYPQHERESIEFLALDYLVLSRSSPLHQVLQRGHELVREGNADPMIYEILIQACQRAGHAAEAEALVLTAARLWPTRTEKYQALLQSPPV
jgi:DNA-binding NarL/FixJ family response regulator